MRPVSAIQQWIVLSIGLLVGRKYQRCRIVLFLVFVITQNVDNNVIFYVTTWILCLSSWRQIFICFCWSNEPFTTLIVVFIWTLNNYVYVISYIKWFTTNIQTFKCHIQEIILIFISCVLEYANEIKNEQIVNKILKWNEWNVINKLGGCEPQTVVSFKSVSFQCCCNCYASRLLSLSISLSLSVLSLATSFLLRGLGFSHGLWVISAQTTNIGLK
jgi:hypothetical protein